MNFKTATLFVLMLALAWANKANAQGAINDSLVTGSPYINDTTTAVKPNETTQSPVISNKVAKKDTSTFVKHSPKKATLLSVFLPGAGQAYNQKYWKMPIVYVAGGAAVYGIIFYSKEYNVFKAAYAERLNTNANADAFYNQFQTPTLKSYRDYYRYYRDLSYIALGAVYILQIVDATVDAHFFDFKITDDLSLNVQPTYNLVGNSPSTQLLFTFKF